MTADDVRKLLRAACDDAGNQATFAKKAGVSRAYVTDVLKGNRNPGPSILRALGLECRRAIPELSYRKVRI